MKPTVIAISGPTAVGKTAVSIEVAKRTGGEIISCDSMQIYRGMDIGTAKPTPEETAAVRHFLIDVADPSSEFSCADYKRLADEAIRDILSRGKLPIFCGGTGLYLESVLYGTEFSSAPADKELRKKLSENPPEVNWERLVRVDPDAAAKTHPNNIPRVVRALEIYDLTGVTKTEWDRASRVREPEYDAKIFVLTASDRKFLYDRIDRRVDIMLENGLLDEVKRLRPDPRTTAGQAIGYKEFTEYLDGKTGYDEAVGRIKQASRNYAKRQETWWRRSKDAVFVDVCSENFENIVNFIVSSVKKNDLY